MDALKQAVLNANRDLVRCGLVLGTWGNASAVNRQAGVMVIKPSGVAYDSMTADQMVAVDFEGRVVGGSLRPSSDTPTHLALYAAFPEIGGIVHTHSHFATCWAQACRPIPCLGTTHADYFYGEIPVTDSLMQDEVESDYERNTGEVIVRRFEGIDPLRQPAVLVANHGPFTWGATVEAAVECAVILEEVARLALHSLRLAPNQLPIPQYLLDKHFLRKHGERAYYGQSK
ncbi:MAG: L-ribulose-5-phosphate 4-epimerase AraD [Candidatus Hydrogenedentes bacterium]|nr:L-ribulose-5-phosphate 4-epimerase AraD [Candidatus Hydrogenedentota bacterium]